MASGRNRSQKGDTGRDADSFAALPWTVLDCPTYAFYRTPPVPYYSNLHGSL